MDIEMKYIYAIYKEGSFTKAAEKLYVTQPTISLAVKRVERDLGMPLFERRNNRLELTAAGQIYLERIKLVRQIDFDFYDEINDLKNLKKGTLRIVGTSYVISYVLAPIIRDFQRDYPDIKLIINEDSSDSLRDIIHENGSDLAFVNGDIDERLFHSEPCFRDEALLIAPDALLQDPELKTFQASCKVDSYIKGNPIYQMDVSDLKYFDQLPLLLLTPNNPLHHIVKGLFRLSGTEPNISLMLDQLVTSYRLAIEGVGVTFIGSRLIKHKKEQATFFSINTEATKRNFSVIINKSRYISLPMREFITRVQHYYSTP